GRGNEGGGPRGDADAADRPGLQRGRQTCGCKDACGVDEEGRSARLRGGRRRKTAEGAVGCHASHRHGRGCARRLNANCVLSGISRPRPAAYQPARLANCRRAFSNSTVPRCGCTCGATPCPEGSTSASRTKPMTHSSEGTSSRPINPRLVGSWTPDRSAAP